MGTGLGNIVSRPLGRAGLEGAPPRATIKEGHILEGHLTAGEYFGRLLTAGEYSSVLNNRPGS